MKSLLRCCAATALLVAILPFSARAQSAVDSAEIRSAALDYIQGWYTADAARMERALHPELAKRMVQEDPKSQKSVLDQMGAKQLVQYTREGGVIAKDWVDYLHLARWNGRWQIVNVLWELKPRNARAASR
jgi:hypothetical protein